MDRVLRLIVAGACAGAALVIAGLAPAAAQTRIEAANTDCASITRTLIREGAAIIRYPARRTAGLTLYDRYVGDSILCQSNEVGRMTSVPARDGACRVIACEVFDPTDRLPGLPIFQPRLRLGS